MPANSTLYRLLERLGIDTRYLGRPADRHKGAVGRAAPPFTGTSAIAPGEVVQIDSTDLEVKVLGDDGPPTAVEMTAAVDVATRSMIAAVVRPDTVRRRHRVGGHGRGWCVRSAAPDVPPLAVDASLLLAQVFQRCSGAHTLPGCAPASSPPTRCAVRARQLPGRATGLRGRHPRRPTASPCPAAVSSKPPRRPVSSRLGPGCGRINTGSKGARLRLSHAAGAR